MAQPRIFVSYSHDDSAFAQRLVNDLERAGARVWYDISGIGSGDFIQRIDEALRECEWLVLVLSPSAITSSYVQMETNAGLHRVHQRQMRGVIPIVARPCLPNSIPVLWDVLQRYDATSGYEAAWQGLMRALGMVSPAASAATPTPEASRWPAASAAPAASSRPVTQGVQYGSVRAALSAKNLKEADEESIRIIQNASGYTEFNSDGAIAAIPDDVLRTLDQLWRDAGTEGLQSRGWVRTPGFFSKDVTDYVAWYSFETWLERRLKQLGLK